MTPARHYLPQLDALRFGAFFVVFLHHSFPVEVGPYAPLGALAPVAAAVVRSGGYGVDLFFVLSSFLITSLLLREHAQGPINVRWFYLRRALRIMPLYFLVVGLGIIASGFFGQNLPGPYALAFLLFAGNWAVVFGGYPASFVAPLWSVCIEEQFYLAWPLVLRKPERLMKIAIGMIGIALVSRVVLAVFDVPHTAIWTNTFARLDPIALGAILAIRPVRIPTWVLPIAVAALVGGELVMTFVAPQYGIVPIYLTNAAACAAIVGWAVNASLDERNVLVYLGKISYGLYAYHILVISLGNALVPDTGIVLALAKIPATFAITVLLAWLSYEQYEKRFLKFKERFEVVKTRKA